MIGDGDDPDPPIARRHDRRLPRGGEVGAGPGVGDAGRVQDAHRLQQAGHLVVGGMVVGQRGEVDAGEAEGLDHAGVGPEVERLVAVVAPAFGVRGQGALEVDQQQVDAVEGVQQVAPGVGEAPLGNLLVDSATEHHVAGERDRHLGSHRRGHGFASVRSGTKWS